MGDCESKLLLFFKYSLKGLDLLVPALQTISDSVPSLAVCGTLTCAGLHRRIPPLGPVWTWRRAALGDSQSVAAPRTSWSWACSSCTVGSSPGSRGANPWRLKFVIKWKLLRVDSRKLNSWMSVAMEIKFRIKSTHFCMIKLADMQPPGTKKQQISHQTWVCIIQIASNLTDNP